jgi:O-antigen ligase
MGLNIYPIDLLLVCSLISILLTKKNKIILLFQEPCLKYYILFLFWMLFSVVRNLFIYKNSAIGDSRQVFLFLFFFITYYISTKINIDEINHLLVNVIIYSTIGVILLFIIEINIGHRFGFSFESIETANYGMLEDPRGIRILGSGDTFILCISSIFIIVKSLNTRIIKKRDLIILIILIIAIVISQNRTAIISTSLAFIFYLISIYPIKKILKYIAIGIPILILLIAVIGSLTNSFQLSLKDIITSTFNPNEDKIGTGSWRLLVVTSALEKFMTNPIIGEGFGGGWLLETNDSFVTIPPHNQYVSILVKTGIVGLIIFSMFIFKFIKSYFNNRTRFYTDTKITFDVMFIALIAALPYGLGYDYYAYYGLYIGIYFGLLVKKEMPTKETSQLSTFASI